MPAIGFLSSRSPGESASVVAVFRAGLQEAGYRAFRWADGRVPLAELLDRRQPVCVARNGSATNGKLDIFDLAVSVGQCLETGEAIKGRRPPAADAPRRDS